MISLVAQGSPDGMPIDTIEKALYPKNWKDLSLRIREDANWTCKNCGRPCRRPDESKQDFLSRLQMEHPDWLMDLVESSSPELKLIADKRPEKLRPKHYGRFKLTTAHLNQDRTDNSPDNLGALCACCHLDHDRAFSRFHSFMKLCRRGQQIIPGLDYLFLSLKER